MAITPSASYGLTARVQIRNRPGIPSVFNKKAAPAVVREVTRAAHRAGVARRGPRSRRA